MHEVWLLCLATNKHVFPNLSVIGIYTTRLGAQDILKTLPAQKRYLLYRIPLDQFLGHITKNGDLQDGMGKFPHEHFEPEDTPSE